MKNVMPIVVPVNPHMEKVRKIHLLKLARELHVDKRSDMIHDLREFDAWYHEDICSKLRDKDVLCGGRYSYGVLNLNTGKYYPTVKEAVDDAKISRQSIYTAATSYGGTDKNGCSWRMIDDSAYANTFWDDDPLEDEELPEEDMYISPIPQPNSHTDLVLKCIEEVDNYFRFDSNVVIRKHDIMVRRPGTMGSVKWFEIADYIMEHVSDKTIYTDDYINVLF